MNELVKELIPYRIQAREILSPDIPLGDRKDTMNLLTFGFSAFDKLKDRKDVENYFNFAINNQGTLLVLAREFDRGIQLLNRIGDFKRAYNPDVFPNIAGVKERLTKAGIKELPTILGKRTVNEEETRDFLAAYKKALTDQNRFMQTGEAYESLEQMPKDVYETYEWSRIHLDAKNPRQFLAAFITDIFPMVLRRTDKYSAIDTDQLVCAVCEAVWIANPNSPLFSLLKEQGWINPKWGFSEKFVELQSETTSS